MFGYLAWKAGMILSDQIVRSSFRQLSMVRVTAAPPPLAAGGWDAPGAPVAGAVLGLAPAHAPKMTARTAATIVNLRFTVTPPPACDRRIAPPTPRVDRLHVPSTCALGLSKCRTEDTAAGASAGTPTSGPDMASQRACGSRRTEGAK